MSIHRWFTGLFLLVIMLGVLFINAWVFSARSFQDNFAKISGNGTGVVSTQAITNARRQIITLEAQAAPEEMRVAGLARQVEDANIKIDKLAKQLDDAAKTLAVKVAALEAKAKAPGSADPDADKFPGLASRIEQLQKLPALAPGDIKPLTADLDQLASVNEQIVTVEESKKQVEADSRALQASLNDNRQRLLSQKTQFGDHFDQIETEIESLQNSSPLGFGARLAEIHPTFLSVLLVCLMGALGSMLFLFPAYIANRPGMEVTFDTIIVRTAFGVVVAFAFFIVANLGIAVFGVTAGASAQPVSANLNPFTAAGLGIVAGVMGDDIARWIHDRGAYLFKGATEGGGLADIVRGAATGASPPATPIAPTKADLPSGGLINPHGGPNERD